MWGLMTSWAASASLWAIIAFAAATAMAFQGTQEFSVTITRSGLLKGAGVLACLTIAIFVVTIIGAVAGVIKVPK